jgi:hypothetical protein
VPLVSGAVNYTASKWQTDNSLLPGLVQKGGKSLATPMDELDPGSPKFTEALLRDARKDFPSFYATATPEDANFMDG